MVHGSPAEKFETTVLAANPGHGTLGGLKAAARSAVDPEALPVLSGQHHEEQVGQDPAMRYGRAQGLGMPPAFLEEKAPKAALRLIGGAAASGPDRLGARREVPQAECALTGPVAPSGALAEAGIHLNG